MQQLIATLDAASSRVGLRYQLLYMVAAARHDKADSIPFQPEY